MGYAVTGSNVCYCPHKIWNALTFSLLINECHHNVYPFTVTFYIVEH